VRYVNRMNGQQIELNSVSVSGVTCWVREGNALSDS
jgi:hypothetical protein